MKSNRLIITTTEVAEYLRIPLSTIYKLCQEGRIPATKVGKHWRFRKKELDDWFNKNDVTIKKK